MRIKEKDLAEDSKLSADFQKFEMIGRTERDEKIEKLQGRLEKIEDQWRKAKFAGKNKKFWVLENEKNTLLVEIDKASREWSAEFDRVRGARDQIRGPYLSFFINEIQQEIIRIQKEFKFEWRDKIFNFTSLRYQYTVCHNGNLIDEAVQRLLEFKFKLQQGAQDISLSEIIKTYDGLTKDLPDEFALVDKIEGNSDVIAAFRERLLNTGDKLFFPVEDRIVNTLPPGNWPAPKGRK